MRGFCGGILSVLNVIVGLVLAVTALPLLAFGILRIAFSLEDKEYSDSALLPLVQEKWTLVVGFGATMGIFWLLTSIVLLVLALLGVCATLTEKRSFAWTVMLLLTIFTILMMGTTHSLSVWAPRRITEDLYWSLEKSAEGNERAVNAWNSLQNQSRCCGVEGYQDWETLDQRPYPNENGSRVPHSCCSWLQNTFLVEDCTKKPNLYGPPLTTGCGERVQRVLWIDALVAAGVSLVLIMQLGVFCCFGQCLTPERRRVHREYERI